MICFVQATEDHGDPARHSLACRQGAIPEDRGCVQSPIITKGRTIQRMKPATDPVISHSESVHASVRIF